MKPPHPFKYKTGRKGYTYGLCPPCGRWVTDKVYFHHEGTNWILCRMCFDDYWFNVDELLPDYKWYAV